MSKRALLCAAILLAVMVSACASAPQTPGVGAEAPGLSDPSGPPASLSAVGAETERKKLALRRAVATGLRDEAYALQRKGQLRDAVIRYRQSLVYWPDTGLESYIAPLEQKAGFAASQYKREAGQGAAGPAETRVYATVRNRSARDITLAVSGEAPEAATTVRAGEIRIRPVRPGPGGEVTFEVSQDGRVLETRGWRGIPNSSAVVPALLYDDTLKGRLFVMTGLR